MSFDVRSKFRSKNKCSSNLYVFSLRKSHCLYIIWQYAKGYLLSDVIVYEVLIAAYCKDTPDSSRYL